MRALARLVLLAWSLASLAMGAWIWSQNPLAAPLVARTASEARTALSAAVARQVTPDWLLPRIRAAVAADDMVRLDLLTGLARDHDIALPADLSDAVAQMAARHQGWAATARDCGRCMTDVSACPSLTLISACTLPFELSPAGDAAALLRQGRAYAAGEDVDRVQASLASVGLLATAAGVATLGGSLSVKAAATTLRVAHRADALSPGMQRAVIAAARSPATMAPIAGDLGVIARATSGSELLPILRLADGPDDLRDLARLSDVAGPGTRSTLEVLGKTRSLRLLVRLGDLAVAALAVMALLLAQAAALAGSVVRLILRRALRPAPVRPARWPRSTARNRPVLRASRGDS